MLETANGFFLVVRRDDERPVAQLRVAAPVRVVSQFREERVKFGRAVLMVLVQVLPELAHRTHPVLQRRHAQLPRPIHLARRRQLLLHVGHHVQYPRLHSARVLAVERLLAVTVIAAIPHPVAQRLVQRVRARAADVPRQMLQLPPCQRLDLVQQLGGCLPLVGCGTRLHSVGCVRVTCVHVLVLVLVLAWFPYAAFQRQWVILRWHVNESIRSSGRGTVRSPGEHISFLNTF